MIRAAAFDLDNTLIDFMRFKRETAKAAAGAMVKAGLDAKPGKVARQIFGIYGEYGIEYQKTFSTLLWGKYRIRDLNRFEHIQQAGITAYLKRKFEVLRPYPDVVPTLKKLDVPHYIVTDAPRNKAWQRLVVTGLDRLFDGVVTYDDTKRHKPDPMPFKAFLKEFSYGPEEVLFVGDSLERDIAGAKKAGMKTAWAKYGADRKRGRVKPDYVLEKFGDLLKCV